MKMMWMNLIKGCLLAIITIGISLLLPEMIQQIYFAILLGVAAGVYIGFAIVDQQNLILEIVVAISFAITALFSFVITPLLLAIGWLFHALWDFLHHQDKILTKTSESYPVLCLSYDVVLAIYLLIRFFPSV